MSSNFVETQWTQNSIVANHWRSLTIHSILSQLKLNNTMLLQQQNITELKQYCNGKKECMKGMASNGWHDNAEYCLLMLADRPG